MMEQRVVTGLGRWWATLLRRLASLRGAPGPSLPRRPFIRRRWNTTELQFARDVVQSRMLTFAPDKLLIDYTRTMLGALVLVPRPRSIGMIGLGGGSQTKFCYRHLPDARIEVVDNNPQVIALRRKFRIPDDDARLRVVLDDGARLLQARRAHYDLLLVDGYDASGLPAALSSQQFYDDCRAALTEGGAMAVNLYCDDTQRHIDCLHRSFGRNHVAVVEETRQTNCVALAWVGTPAPATAPMALSAAGQRELAPALARMRVLLDQGMHPQSPAQRRRRSGAS